MNTQTATAPKEPIYIPFITEDITITDFNFDDLDRYEFTSKLKSGEITSEDYNFTGTDFNTWAEENLSYEELYEIPMMNSVYYYPSFVTFKEEDRYKVASTTTLFFDIEEEAWAVGMTGGGMDLAPHLLETFIQLDKGIPMNIALAIRKNYSGYVNIETH